MRDQRTIRLLGPLEVAVNGTARSVPGLRRRTILAALALRATEVVSSAQLVDIVWGDSSPATAVNTLQSHISYLRKVFLTRDSIVATAPGYRLVLHDGATDVQIAERLIEQGRRSKDPRVAASLLTEALSLWRGQPLADLGDHVWLDEQADRLGHIRRTAVKALATARLVLGEHSSLVSDLAGMTREWPFDEDLHGQLMVALYRAGRQADALTVIHRLRKRLREDLGIDPSRRVRAVEEAILRHDASMELSAQALWRW